MISILGGYHKKVTLTELHTEWVVVRLSQKIRRVALLSDVTWEDLIILFFITWPEVVVLEEIILLEGSLALLYGFKTVQPHVCLLWGDPGHAAQAYREFLLHYFFESWMLFLTVIRKAWRVENHVARCCHGGRLVAMGVRPRIRLFSGAVGRRVLMLLLHDSCSDLSLFLFRKGGYLHCSQCFDRKLF